VIHVTTLLLPSAGRKKVEPSPVSPPRRHGRNAQRQMPARRRRRLQVSGPPLLLVSGLLASARGTGVHLLVDRVLNRVLLGLGFAHRRCSVVKFGSAGGAWLLCGLVFLAVGDAEATTLQRNNFSQLLPFSDGDLLRRQWRGCGDLSRC
jgi:hypothetical protein